jgi:cobalt-zinc-cadmium efflux system outer membrane protein
MAIACLDPSGATAEPVPPFSELVRQAEMTAPRLAERQANIRAAQGAQIQAGVRPNPTVDLLAENLGTAGSNNGLSLEQTTLSVNQPLEIGGQRSARIAAANAALQSAQAELQQARSDFVYDLALAYITAEVAVAREASARQTLDRAQEDQRAAQALVNAGREADLRAVEANAATAVAQVGLETSEADVTVAFVRLSELVGRSPPFTAIGQTLLNSTLSLRPPSLEPTGVSPAVRSAEAAREAAERRIRMERTRAIPDLTLSLGVRQFGGENAKALVAGIGIPLPLFNNNSGNVATAEAELAAADARLETARLNANADWRAAAVQALAANRQVTAAAQAEQAANEAYRLARIGFDAGRTPLIEVLTARQGATESQLRSVEAKAARLRAEAILARLMGTVPFGGNQ